MKKIKIFYYIFTVIIWITLVINIVITIFPINNKNDEIVIEDYGIGVIIEQVYVSNNSNGQYYYLIEMIEETEKVTVKHQHLLENGIYVIIIEKSNEELEILPLNKNIKEYFNDTDEVIEEYERALYLYENFAEGLISYYENEKGTILDYNDFKTWAYNKHKLLYELLLELENKLN